jgi:ketosteroid isomerase-like protein
MKKYTILLCLIFNMQLVFAQADTARAAAEKYIRAARAESNAAIAKKNIDGVAKFWTNDFVEIISDGSLLCGKEPVIADWKIMFDKDPSIRFERQFGTIEFARGGTVAMEKGILIYTSPYNYKGYYTALWRKVDGVWVTQMENFVSIL